MEPAWARWWDLSLLSCCFQKRVPSLCLLHGEHCLGCGPAVLAETGEELVYWGGDGHSNKSTSKYVTVSGNKCQEGKKGRCEDGECLEAVCLEGMFERTSDFWINEGRKPALNMGGRGTAAKLSRRECECRDLRQEPAWPVGGRTEASVAWGPWARGRGRGTGRPRKLWLEGPAVARSWRAWDATVMVFMGSLGELKAWKSSSW